VVLPVPYDGTASYKAGAREGPRAIIEASRQLEDLDLELERETCRLGIHTLPELEPHAAGPKEMVLRVASAVEPLAQGRKVVAVLGGDHSITIGAVQGLLKVYPDLSVLYLDAHADLRDHYQGTPLSHACAARRVWETCPLVIVGVRSLAQEEQAFIHAHKVPVLFWTPDTSVKDIVESALRHLSPHLYITVDLDVLDPSIMPAVGTPEPGGMSWTELLSVLRAVAQKRRIVGFDVTELCPREGPSASAYTAAKLVYKLMGYSTLSIFQD
jgi:agmatinase